MLTLETTVTSLTVVTQSKVFRWTQAIEPASRSRGLQWPRVDIKASNKSSRRFHSLRPNLTST